jgi:hypothetical protein
MRWIKLNKRFPNKLWNNGPQKIMHTLAIFFWLERLLCRRERGEMTFGGGGARGGGRRHKHERRSITDVIRRGESRYLWYPVRDDTNHMLIFSSSR